jgi:DNA-nicking Smr family endonuclease
MKKISGNLDLEQLKQQMQEASLRAERRQAELEAEVQKTSEDKELSDDTDVFKLEMTDVQAIKDKSTRYQRKLEKITPGQAERRQAAELEQTADTNPLGTEYLDLVAPHDEISYKRDGIQWGVYKKLKHGQYPVESRLDLHRRTMEQARIDVYRFVMEAREHDLRCVLITHGKGDRADRTKALLKSYTAKWLKELDCVLAYHSAEKRHGGVGAVYVLLRKSDRLKGENRERHGGRT